MLRMTVALKDNCPTLFVRYGNEEVEYDITRTSRRNSRLGGVFDKANQYFQTLPEDDARRFFGILKREKNNRKGELSSPELMVDLKNEVRKAVGYLNFNRFLSWFRENYEGLFIPDTMLNAPIDYNQDRGESEKKTYNKADFIDFVGMSTFLGMFFPLYTDYLTYQIVNGLHPHYRIFKLFLDSDIDKEVGPLSKLREYITEIHRIAHGSSGQQNIIIAAGLTSDDVTDYFVAEALLNKLSLENYFDDSRAINPISHIHQLVKYSGQFKSSRTSNIDIKRARTSVGGEEEFAVFEENRKTTDIAPGLIDEQRSALNNDNNILIGLGYQPEKFDWAFYQNELKNLPELLQYPIEDTTTYLLAWFLKNTVSPRALSQIDSRRVIELLLMAKTCMFMENTPALRYMATFLSSVYEKDAPYVNPNVIVKGSLSPELTEELMSMFKHHIEDRGLVPVKVVLEFSRRIANLTWRPIGAVDPMFIVDGYLGTPDNINAVVIAYIRYVLNLGVVEEVTL